MTVTELNWDDYFFSPFCLDYILGQRFSKVGRQNYIWQMGGIKPGVRKVGFQPPFSPWTNQFVSLDLGWVIYKCHARFYLQGLHERETETIPFKLSSSMPGREHSVGFNWLSNWMTALGASQWLFTWFNEGNILQQNLKIHLLSTFSKWLESIIVNNSALALHRVTALPEWKDIILRNIDHQTLIYLFSKVFWVPSNHWSFYPCFFPL